MIDTTSIDFCTAQEFAAVDEPGAEPLVVDADGCAAFPAVGIGIVYGDGGVGKTTLLLDGAVHFAAGAAWLNVKPARPLCILWIENEGPRPEFRKKIGEKLKAWDGPDIGNRLHLWQEPWGTFSFRNENHRAALIQRLQDIEADMLIVGPLKSVGMQGGGTDDDISDFLQHVAAVQHETGVAVLLVHHENRAGQMSGAWDSRTDTTIHVQAQGHGRTRIYWQKTRWSSLLHQTSSNLLWADGKGFEVEEREQVTDETIADRLLAATLEHSGGSWNTIDSATSGNASDKRRVRDELVAEGRLVTAKGPRGAMLLWHHLDPAKPTASNPGTQSGTQCVLPAVGEGGDDCVSASSYKEDAEEDAVGQTHFDGPESMQDSLDDAVGF